MVEGIRGGTFWQRSRQRNPGGFAGYVVYHYNYIFTIIQLYMLLYVSLVAMEIDDHAGWAFDAVMSCMSGHHADSKDLHIN